MNLDILLSSTFKKSSLTFFDIDDTLFNTSAMIRIMDDKNNLVKLINNSEFNDYKLKPNEHFDFSEFKSSKLFHDTSKPIKKNIDRLKKMLDQLNLNSNAGKIIILTARSSFDDKELFLQTFRNHDINIDNKDIIYIERVGDIKNGLPIPEKKSMIILNYLKTGKYNIVRLIDDYIENINIFRNFANSFPENYPNIIELVRKNFNLNNSIPFNNSILWYPLLANSKTGTLKLIPV